MEDGLGLPFIERLGRSSWLRWVAEVNVEIMVVDEVKTKRFMEVVKVMK